MPSSASVNILRAVSHGWPAEAQGSRSNGPSALTISGGVSQSSDLPTFGRWWLPIDRTALGTAASGDQGTIDRTYSLLVFDSSASSTACHQAAFAPWYASVALP